MIRNLLALVLVGFAVAACQTESLSNYPTSQVWASITSQSDGTNTHVAATFQDGPSSLTFFQLTSDDTAQASVGNTTQALDEFSLGGAVSYSSDFNNVNTGTFKVSLTRKKDSGAPNSTVTLPAVFTINQASATFSRAQPMTLSWTSATDPNQMAISISGSCINTFNTTASAGATQVTIAAGSLTKTSGGNYADGGMSIPDSCQASAKFDRSQNGTIDPAYKGGSIQGTQERTISFTTTP